MKRIDEAVTVISRHLGWLGLPQDRMRVLRDSSHVTVAVGEDWVVRAREDQGETLERMEREIGVSRFLAERWALVTRPAESPLPGPHQIDGWLLGYWKKEEEIPEDHEKRDVQEVVAALCHCHRLMGEYVGPLPDFREESLLCVKTLQMELANGPLPARDFAFLQQVFVTLWRQLDTFSYQSRPLHGDCHPGNVMKTARGYLWTDWESACRGPIEWDVSSLPKEAEIYFSVDRKLCRLLRSLRSWCVAIWCWAAYDRLEEKRAAADFHLAELRKRFDLGI
jgi:hypothetical protein